MSVQCLDIVITSYGYLSMPPAFKVAQSVWNLLFQFFDLGTQRYDHVKLCMVLMQLPDNRITLFRRVDYLNFVSEIIVLQR